MNQQMGQSSGNLLPLDVNDLVTKYRQGERRFARVALRGAKLRGLTLQGIELEGADLSEADFGPLNRSCQYEGYTGTDLRNANLSDAVLVRANFSYTDLRGASLRNALIAETTFAGLDLSSTDLQGIVAYGGCSVGIDTIFITAGKLCLAPESKIQAVEAFWKEVGVPTHAVELFRYWIRTL